MRKSGFAVILLVLSALSAALFAKSSQTSQDSSSDNDKFVRLMSAQSVRIIEKDGKTFRKAEGPARFLHNNTWLICDTALWNVDDQMIYASGHVRIEQETTELISDSLTYSIRENLARFRGRIVELKDKEGNTLRTMNLDYNTRDSVATFRSGASMRDKKGQIIESLDGTYEARPKLFTFTGNVNMFSDSVFVKTSLLLYETRPAKATFPEYVEAWKDDKMLSSHSGWYLRNDDLFFFTDDVHTMSEEKEGWCDSLYFNKKYQDVELLGNVQLVDTTRDVVSLAGYMHYVDTCSLLTMTRNPVVIMVVEEKDSVKTVKDSAFMRADSILYWSRQRFAIDSAMFHLSEERIKLLNIDPVANIRAKAAEELAKRVKEAEENDPNRPPQRPDEAEKAQSAPKQSESEHGGTGSSRGKDGPPRGKGASPADKSGPPPGMATAEGDTLALEKSPALVDSLARADSIALADSLARIPKDSTKIGFLSARHSVKIFKKDLQMVCDSLEYCDLDSLARMFKEPYIWKDRSHQYNADSIYVLIQDEKMRKADLMSNAFIHIAEDGKFYDQIRATEMMAYFNDSTQLSRFDAMGSATGLFFLKEKDRIATANRKESAILSATFKGGEIDRITYYQDPKSNAYPVAQMSNDDLHLKGFGWKKDLRPESAAGFTQQKLRKSQRKYYSERPRAEFPQTQLYFRGYMDKIYREIERTDSLRRASQRQSMVAPVPPADSLSSPSDTTIAAVAASQSADTVSVADAAGVVAAAAGATTAACVAASGAAAGAESGAAPVASAGVAAVASDASVTGTAPQPGPVLVLVHPDDSLSKSGSPGFGHVLLLDSLKRHVRLDSLGMKLYLDTLRTPVLRDSLGRQLSLDSLGWTVSVTPFTEKEMKKAAAAARRKVAEEKRAARIAAKEEKWRVLDERDAAKKAAKQAEKEAKLRAREEAYIRKMAARKEEEDVLLKKYKERYFEKLRKKAGL